MEWDTDLALEGESVPKFRAHIQIVAKYLLPIPG